jgi:dTDP-4-amino-4,6-dideoxygalactose transaminase
MTWPPTRDLAIRDAVLSVLQRGILVGGPEVEALELEFADKMELNYAVAVSSGTAAITAALLAAGVKAGDRVVVPAFTFSGSVLPVLHIGAVPVFVDVQRDTYCVDPARATEVAFAVGATAVLLVHLHGYPVYVPYDLRSDLEGRGIHLIEDACQAAGARFPSISKSKVGALGTASAYSLNEKKQVFAGEGGIFATTSEELASIVRRLRRYGEPVHQPDACWRSYESLDVGYNWKLAELPAAMARVSLHKLEQRTEIACQNADILNAAISKTKLQPPSSSSGRHAWHKYRVRCSEGDREAIMMKLQKLGVPVSLWQTRILPDMPAFRPSVELFNHDYSVARKLLSESFVIGDEAHPLCSVNAREVSDWAEKISMVCK